MASLETARGTNIQQRKLYVPTYIPEIKVTTNKKINRKDLVDIGNRRSLRRYQRY